MSEEEIIKTVENFLDGYRQFNVETGETYVPYKYGQGQKFCCVEDFEAIQGLLDRYNNLKQIEKEHQKLNGELREELEKEKEKNEKDYTSVYLKGVYDERGKWRDKIKERYEKLKHYDYIEIKELLKLLEEE